MVKIKEDIPSYIMKLIMQAETQRTGNNLTRFYSYLEKQHGAVTIATVAVKDGKAFKGKKHPTKYIKKVVVIKQGEDVSHCRDVYYISMGGYIAKFEAEEALDQKSARRFVNENLEDWWECDNRYFRLYNRSGLLNPEFLETCDEFKYCGWDGKSDILDYLNAYKKDNKVEIVTKVMGSRFALSKSFMKKLNTDAKFLKWLLANKAECKELDIPVLLSAYKNRDKWSIQRTRAENAIKRYFIERPYGPYGYKPKDTLLQTIYKNSDDAGKEKIRSFIIRNEITPHHYCDYLTALQELSLDINDTKNVFPINWKYWQRVRLDQYATMLAKRDAKKCAEMTRAMRKIAKKYSGLMFSGKDYAVIIADSKESLIREGEILQHCVGRMNYDQRICREESLIFFIRNVNEIDTPFVTVEFSLTQKKVLQCYGYNDSQPNFAVSDFVERWAERAKAKVEKIQSKAA